MRFFEGVFVDFFVFGDLINFAKGPSDDTHKNEDNANENGDNLRFD